MQLPKLYRDTDTGLVHVILRRIPRTMSGTLDLDATDNGIAFDADAFLHTVGLPFEITRIFPRAVFLDNSSGQPIIPPGTSASADEFVRLNIIDTSRDQKVTQKSTFVSDLVDALTKVWYLDEPYYIKNQYGFQVFGDNTSVSQNARAKLTFQGSLLVLAPGKEAPLDMPLG